MAVNPLYTTGYLNWRNPDSLRQFVLKHGAILVDVRIAPVSKRHEWRYGALVETFGWRYYGIRALGNRNYRDHSAPHRLYDEAEGIRQLMSILDRYPAVMMCACKDGSACHRNTVARLAKAQVTELVVTEVPTVVATQVRLS